MVTIDDIIKLSGASRSTVNRFLAGKPVRKDNEKKIQNAMKELNYRPDKLAKKCNYTILLLSRSSENQHPSFHGYAEMVSAIIKALEKEGANILMQSADAKYIPLVDGVIMYGLSASEEDEIVEILNRRNIPFVFAYREIEQSDISYVTCNNYRAAYEMTEMLIKKGHKRIAVCNNAPNKRNMSEKLRGFKDCMAAHNLSVPSYLVCENSNMDAKLKWMQQLLDRKDDFTAFFGLTDYIALLFMDNARQRGFKIPDDFAVVGMDGTVAAAYSTPRLTSVVIPFKEIGKITAETMLELLNDSEKACVRKYLKYEIACRQSH